MSIRNAACFSNREHRFLGFFSPGEWKLKTYAILGPGREVSEQVKKETESLVSIYLNSLPFDDHYNVGFIGMHLGRGADFVFCNIWASENELHHKFWVSEQPGSGRLAEPQDRHPPVCCYDLELQWHERQAWVRHVLAKPEKADFHAYLADTKVISPSEYDMPVATG